MGERRRSISSKASSQVASRSSPSRRINGVVKRSGSSWSSLSPCALGQMKPRLKTSSRSPRTAVTLSPSRVTSSPQVASQNGQVRWCMRSLTTTAWMHRLSRSSIQSAREAQSRRPPSSNSAHAAWRLRPSTSSGHETRAWRSPARTSQPIRAVSRASTIGGPVAEVGHRARSWGSRARPRRTRGARGRRRPRASGRESSRRRTDRPFREALPGRSGSRRPASRAGPHTTQVGKGCSSVHFRRPPSAAARASSGCTGSGTSSKSSDPSPSATSVAPS